MKVRLVFEYEIKPEDGVGTQNDAILSAVREMDIRLDEADSTDDIAEVFTEIVFK